MKNTFHNINYNGVGKRFMLFLLKFTIPASYNVIMYNTSLQTKYIFLLLLLYFVCHRRPF